MQLVFILVTFGFLVAVGFGAEEENGEDAECNCKDYCLCAKHIHNRLHSIGEKCFERKGLANPYDSPPTKKQEECYDKNHPCAKDCTLTGEKEKKGKECPEPGAEEGGGGPVETQPAAGGDPNDPQNAIDAGRCMGDDVKKQSKGSRFRQCRVIQHPCNTNTKYHQCLGAKKGQNGNGNGEEPPPDEEEPPADEE